MLHAVVMAGGSGTRFWPKSRRSSPKQLLRLFGERTMLQETVARIDPMVPPERVLVVTGADQAADVREQLPKVPAGNVVAEPCPRDTAPCVGLAAAILARRDPDATMIVMAADHVIRPIDQFQRTVAAAVAVVEEDPTAFVTFGIRPTRPETGYGYIERGTSLGTKDGVGVYEVKQFREKPVRELAERYLRDGNFAWNSGIFVWKARAILDALGQFKPELAQSIHEIADAIGQPNADEVLQRVFPSMEKIPIDKAVMEKAENVRMLEVAFDWSDVGDWRSLAELIGGDKNGNTVQGPAHLVETRNTVVISEEGALIATLGVEDLVIVQSGGATLIARKDAMDRLKTLVEGLEKAGFGEAL